MSRVIAVAALAGALAIAQPAAAEVGSIHFAKEYGLPYLPMMVMERQQLVEKEAAKRGIAGLDVQWQTFGGPSAALDGLLSGQIEFAGPGVPTLATVWDKTAGTAQEVRALLAMQSMPFVLVTRNPAVHGVGDFTDQDRIALPAVKTSGHALALEMAAAKLWGYDHYDKLDPITVTLSHPDATRALLSGGSEIDSHFASSPYYYYELATPGIHQVLKSYDVFGGRHTNGVLLATKRFHDANPKICAAVMAAFEEADAFIKANPREAAAIYIAASGEKRDPLDGVVKMVTDPDVEYTTTPVNIMNIVGLMHRLGRIHREPGSWKDLFFAEAYDLPGS
jgi:NitT/TauT family transport system substrate-binding protein